MSDVAVTIETADGVADAHLSTPEGVGPWPAVIMFTDIFGVRPTFLQMAARLAAEGFAVLLPNHFYRVAPAPVPMPQGTFADPAFREAMMALKNGVTPDRVRTDIGAMLDWLQTQPQVSTGKVGLLGYCMTGSFALRGAAYFPARVAAAASFHGGGLATDAPDSPHRLAKAIKAPLVIGHATDDMQMPAEAIAVLNRALDDAGVAHDSEIYPAGHGWCVPGSPAYDEAQAGRAWAKMVALFKRQMAA